MQDTHDKGMVPERERTGKTRRIQDQSEVITEYHKQAAEPASPEKVRATRAELGKLEIRQLRVLAIDNEIDVSGCKTKRQIITKLMRRRTWHFSPTKQQETNNDGN